MSIENFLQLHERIEIYTLVTGYRAVLSTQDGDRDVYHGHGNTRMEALENLETILDESGHTLQSLRSYMPEKPLDKVDCDIHVTIYYTVSGYQAFYGRIAFETYYDGSMACETDLVKELLEKLEKKLKNIRGLYGH